MAGETKSGEGSSGGPGGPGGPGGDSSQDDPSDEIHEVTTLAARAALHLMNWDDLERIVSQGAMTGALDISTHDGAFYNAALALHKDQAELAQHLIDIARGRLAEKMAALVGESYSRFYEFMVWAQRLLEMEEVVRHRTVLRAHGDDYCNEHVVAHLKDMHSIWHLRLDASCYCYLWDLRLFLRLCSSYR